MVNYGSIINEIVLTLCFQLKKKNLIATTHFMVIILYYTTVKNYSFCIV